MASPVRVTQTQTATIDLEALRARMHQHGVTVRKLAETAGIDSDNISAIFSGKQYLGEKRTQRLIDAAIKLGLADDQDESVASA